MEYFLVLTDRRIENPIDFTVNKNELLDFEPFTVNIGKVKSAAAVDFIIKKILFNTYYFLSDGLMNVFKMYDESIGFQPMFVTNEDYSIQEVYWRAEIEETKNVITNIFKDVKDMEINAEALKDRPIHRINYEKQAFLIIDRGVVESILRRLPVGMYFRELKCFNGRL